MVNVKLETAENYVRTAPEFQNKPPEAIEHILLMIANVPGFAESVCRDIQRHLEFQRKVAESDGTPESYAILFRALVQKDMNDHGQ